MTNPPSLFEEETLTNLIKAMALKRPRAIHVLPKWRPSVVLHAFMKPPFTLNGSDKNIDLELLTYKTAFLVSLASAARGAELVALSRADHNISFTQDPSGAKRVSLRMVPNFLPKNVLPNQVPEPITFPGIAHLFPQEKERLLCPVRAIGLYISRTKELASKADTSKLFVHFKADTQVLTTHFRLWVAEAIERAYAMAPQEGPQKVNAHEVRAIAASIAFFKKTPLEDIRSHIGWKSSDVFSSHYLRDMAADPDLEALPLVAAGKAFV